MSGTNESVATNRWEFCLVVALIAIAIGVIAGNTALFLSAVIPLGYVAYGYSTRPPEPDLTVDRTIEPESPTPSEAVSVVCTVRNDGDDPISDLRIVDEPPAELAVDGESRGIATIQPGETATLEYAVDARRGTHTFGDVTLAVRNVSAASEYRERVPIETEFECDDVLERVPLASQTIQHTGRVETDVGGEGLEFYSTRAHQPSDPMNRVDWNRFARTGELTTIEFREERAASVVVVVDVRDESALVRERGELDGLDLSKHAASWLVTSLLDENNRVGVALYGGRGDYLLPRTGRDQIARAQQLLEGEWCGSFGRSRWLSRASSHVDRFCQHLDDEKQIVFVSPVVDDTPIRSVRRFRAYGHAVTVIRPTITPEATTGGRVERIHHRRRLSELRECGARVIEWSPDESLHVAVERAKQGWSG